MAETIVELGKCAKKVEDHLAVYAQHTGFPYVPCTIEEGARGTRDVSVVCGNRRRLLSLPKNPWKRCRLLDTFLTKSVERLKVHTDPLRGTVSSYAQHFETIGWIPEDISGPDCKPIRTEAVKAYETCLEGLPKIPGSYGHCNVEAKAAMESIDRAIKMGTTSKERGIRLGAGSYRTAYALSPKCVMKIANENAGAGANLNEVRDWNKLKSLGNKAALKMFLPIASYHPSGAWVVVPRVEMLTQDEFNRGNLVSKLQETGVMCNDLHMQNWGKVGKSKRIVVIDYGFGLEQCTVKQRQRATPKGLSEREHDIEAQLEKLRQLKAKVRGMSIKH